jgi:hypothetical protein
VDPDRAEDLEDVMATLQRWGHYYLRSRPRTSQEFAAVLAEYSDCLTWHRTTWPDLPYRVVVDGNISSMS